MQNYLCSGNYTGLRPVISQMMSLIITSTSSKCIKKPIAGIRIQPKSHIRITIRAIHKSIDMPKTKQLLISFDILRCVTANNQPHIESACPMFLQKKRLTIFFYARFSQQHYLLPNTQYRLD